MKKLIFLFLCSLLFGVLIYLAPHLLRFEGVRQEISKELNTIFSCRSQVGESHWSWLPVPSIRITNTHISNTEIDIILPEIRVRPSLASILRKKISLAKIVLVRPQVHLKTLDSEVTFHPDQLPDLKFVIKDGFLDIDALEILPGAMTQPVHFEDMDMEISSEPGRLKLNLQAGASFSPVFSANGRIDYNKMYYRFDIHSSEFRPERLFSEFLNGKFAFLDRPFPLTAHIEGLTAANFKITTKGGLPSFQYGTGKKTALELDQGGSVEINRYDGQLLFNLKEIAFLDPQVTLNGTIARSAAAENAPALWRLNLRGEDLDLTGIRRALLDIWPEHEVVMDVCDVIRRGTAKSGRYEFEGSTADFAYLQKMKIWADVDQAEIYVPEIQLLIDTTSGPINIIDGTLNGDNLSARIGKSTGSNGTIHLDLIDDSELFQLDLDLKADLEDLKNVLENIVDDPLFQEELARFDFQGTARGHLSIGDELLDLKTHVTVESMHAQGNYNRYPRPISIIDGSLAVGPHSVDWTDVNLSTGGHQLRRFSGKVDWQEEIKLEINAFDAKLNAKELYEHDTVQINDISHRLKSYLEPMLHKVTGTLQATDTTFTGEVLNPRSWKYHSSLKSNDLTVILPEVPSPLEVNTFSAELDQSRLQFSTSLRTLNNNLQIAGSYRHTLLDKLDGSIVLNGLIDSTLAQWIRSLQLFPETFFPKIPVTVKNLKFTHQQGRTNVYRIQGDIISGAGGDNAQRLTLDLNKQQELQVSHFIFNNQDRQSRLTVNNWTTPPMRTLYTFQGSLHGKTLEALLEKPPVVGGEITGVASLLLSEDQSTLPTIAGYLEGRDITLVAKNQSPRVTLQKIRLSGTANSVMLPELALRIGNDSVTAYGNSRMNMGAINFELYLNSEDISWSSLKYLLDRFDGPSHANKTASSNNTDLPLSFRELLNGTVYFDFDKFRYSKITNGADENTPSKDPAQVQAEGGQNVIFYYLWEPFKGQFTVTQGGESVAEFSSAAICGLDMSGIWHSESDSLSNFYFSPLDQSLLFEDFLPCLGIRQSLVKGEFDIDADLYGIPGDWKKGKVTLTSPKGVIQRFNMLSKILSVVNITELFNLGGLPDLAVEGLPYKNLTIESHIGDNILHIDKARLSGKGLNLSGRGQMDLANLETDFTVYVAPLKMIDSVVTNVPIVGRVLGGKKGSILTFPVSVEGPLQEPEVEALQASDIGKSAMEFIFDTITLPLAVFNPLMPDDSQQESDVVEPSDPAAGPAAPADTTKAEDTPREESLPN